MTSLQTTPTPPTIDAAKLRKWEQMLRTARLAVFHQKDRPETNWLLLDLLGEICEARRTADRSEAEYAAYCDRQQLRADHEFGCVCSDCTAAIVLTEAARTGEACGIVRRK